jgi:putative acetyltransferase
MGGEAMSALSFRPYLPKDAEALAVLYVEAIMVTGEECYSENQCAAWASFGEDSEAFGPFLAGLLTIVAEMEGEIVGFASLKDDKHIKMLYVLPDAGRQGIGRALVGVLELLAQKRGSEALTVDASEVALPLFQKLGYEMQARNTVMIEDEWLANTTLKKVLPQGAPLAAGNA